MANDPLRLRLDDHHRNLDDHHRNIVSFHRWFAMRGAIPARAAIAFTTSPEWLTDPSKVALLAAGDDAAIAAAIIQGSSAGPSGDGAGPSVRLLDMCAGVGTVAAMAARLGFDAISVEFAVVPHLIDRVLHDFAVSLADATASDSGAGARRVRGWRGFTVEVEDFALAVWDGARGRLKEVFEDDVDIRVWVRIVPCPSCGHQVPVLSNARLSPDTAVNVSPLPGDEDALPHFKLLRTDNLDHKGTYEKGICTCRHCHFQFPFQAYELIPLRSVPVAVRMRNSSTLDEIDSPGAYVEKINAASFSSLAASARNLDNRIILAAQQSIFHDSRGGPVSVANALLPRQRAYFVALAESMEKQSAVLTQRPSLTSEHRLSVRSAVALLISAQIDYVNTYTHWLTDMPRPSTTAGPLRLGGLFTEVGGHWLEHFWQSRLHYLLDLIRENSSAVRPVRAIRADAADIPLSDSAVSAVVWDPPYYDGVDYDAFGEPYQAILAAMVPDLASELVVPPRMARQRQAERDDRDLLRQAQEARRVVGAQGRIGVFWRVRESAEHDLARESAELDRFLERMAPAGLTLLRAVRLDTIRPRRGPDTGPASYLVVLQPVPAAAPAVIVDTKKVLALAKTGTLSLYDGLAELLESVWDPTELTHLIPEEFHGSPRQRLVGYLASHPEPEQLLVELGRMILAKELASRGANSDELRELDAKGLAQQLLARLGFAVASPIRFSIRAALGECGKVESRLELADSVDAVRGAFFTCCDHIQRILRYASLAWSHLACQDQWNEAFRQIISSKTSKGPYLDPDMLSFGDYELLFTRLPATFADSDDVMERQLFARISWAFRKGKIHEKLSALVAMRNQVEHNKEQVVTLKVSQLRQKCCAVVVETCAAIEKLDSQHVLPSTLSPDEERRDRYGRRILRLLDFDGTAIDAFVQSETDLTEPLIYFPADGSRRVVDPKFLRAAVVENLLGFN